MVKKTNMCVVASKNFMVQAGPRPLYICGTLERDSEFLAKKAFLFIVYCRVRPRQFLVVHFIYTHTHEEAQTHTRIFAHNFFHSTIIPLLGVLWVCRDAKESMN